MDKKTIDIYLTKLTEQGSLTAYTSVLIAANVEGIPDIAKYAIYAIATAKWLLKG